MIDKIINKVNYLVFNVVEYLLIQVIDGCSPVDIESYA